MVVDYPVLYMIMQSSPYLGDYLVSRNVEEGLEEDVPTTWCYRPDQIRLHSHRRGPCHSFPYHRRDFSRKARFANCFHLDYSQVKSTNLTVSLRPTKLRRINLRTSLVELSTEPAHWALVTPALHSSLLGHFTCKMSTKRRTRNPCEFSSNPSWVPY